MLLVPTAKPADSLVDLPRGPQLLADTLWEGNMPPSAIEQRARDWMELLQRPVHDPMLALEAIAWAQGLPFLKRILGPDDWLAFRDLLLSLPAEVDEQTLTDRPLVHQLLAGELAWTIARRLTDAPFSRRLEKSGRAAISHGLGEILDRQGMLSAAHFSVLHPLLACWVRCRSLAGGLPGGGWGARAEQQYQRFVRHALRCRRPDGWLLLSDAGTSSRRGTAWGRDLLETVLQDGAEEIDRRLAAVALPQLSSGVAAKAPKKTDSLPSASVHSEDGAIAILRRNWNRDAERVAVLFAGRTCELELVASGRVAASGTWQFEVAQQGQRLEPISDWESNCWHSDEDVDYLELEIELTGGVKLQRQIVLAREDRFLLLADAVMSPQCGNLEYRSVLPLAPQVEFRGAGESREGFLVQARGEPAGGKSPASARPLAQVLPLAMPEWRAQQSGGDLAGIPRGLELRQSAAAQRLYAPLFIDLDRGRFRRRMTWRQLTVAEWLTALPPEVAVGFRVAIGAEQWIIYRSLAPQSNRTLLGHNLATESLVARFGKDGEVTSIIEIE